MFGGETIGLGLPLHFLEADFWFFDADLTDGEFDGFIPGLDKLGFKFSEFLSDSSTFDRFDLESFAGVTDPADLAFKSMDEFAGRVANALVKLGFLVRNEGVKNSWRGYGDGLNG